MDEQDLYMQYLRETNNPVAAALLVLGDYLWYTLDEERLTRILASAIRQAEDLEKQPSLQEILEPSGDGSGPLDDSKTVK